MIGLGGSAINDAGAGMATAVGARFLDANGSELPRGGAEVRRCGVGAAGQRGSLGLDERLARSEFGIACDVDNPLLGQRGASAVFGPQKGASLGQVVELDRALTRWALADALRAGPENLAKAAEIATRPLLAKLALGSGRGDGPADDAPGYCPAGWYRGTT